MLRLGHKAGTTAEISRKVFPDLFLRGILDLRKHGKHIHNKTGLQSRTALRLAGKKRPELLGFSCIPSIVTIFLPSMRAVSMEQERMGCPSISTVHSPQLAVSQPRFTL